MLDAGEWGIPTLDLSMQATEVVLPVRKWGTQARRLEFHGTYHFYADDFLWTRLAYDPMQLVRTGCRCAVEPNFSTHPGLAAAEVLFDVYRKRRIARAWQQSGVHILVDCNVEPCFRDLALLGVPAGWRAYATRKQRGSTLEQIEADRRCAVERAGTEDILFVVFGGGQGVGVKCRDNGWLWVPEYRDGVVRRRKAQACG